MPERLRFERELSDLGLSESETFDEWKLRGKRLTMDFYDRSDLHLAYLGRLMFRWNTDLWETRLINRGDMEEIFKANRLKDADPSDYAFSAPFAPPEDRLFPENKGKQPHFHRTKIGEQSRRQSLLLQVDSHAAQQRQLDDLLKKAKSTKKEQGFYIVVEINDKQRTARLYFLPATPASSSSEDFTFNLDFPAYERGATVDKKIRYVPGDRNKQVIGTVHTHYLNKPPSVEQTTTTGMKDRPGGTTVKSLVHAVSALDINSATENQIAVFAVEADQIHRAAPDGRVTNGQKRRYDVLGAALSIFCGRL